MRLLISGILILVVSFANSQTVSCDTVGTSTSSGNIYSLKLFGDSLCTSFCIVIKKEVKAHKHASHSEHVVVIDGEGEVTLSGKRFPVKKGDVIFIPENTVHSVVRTGKKPLKVISVQAPLFDGTDRIMIEEKK